MSLPDEVRAHHTAWVGMAGGGADHPPVPVRYALAGESLVMFGDEELSGVADGSRVVVTIHEIHDGPPLASFGATLRDVRSLSKIAGRMKTDRVSGDVEAASRSGVDGLA